MLFSNLKLFCNGILVLMGIIMICAVYTYYVNSRRPADDPKKKKYHPLAMILAPITFPAFLILYVSFFLLRVLAYGVFMVFFILALILFRKPFILTALQKIATAVGDRLLEANTFLVRLFLSPWIKEPEGI